MVLFRGKSYRSWAEAARSFGLKPNTLYKANLQGRLDRVGLNPGGSKSKCEPVEIDGVLYASHKEACKRLKISKSTLTRWLDRGGLGVPTSERGFPVVLDGIEYRSMSEASRKLGIPRSTIHDRISRGDTERKKPDKPPMCTGCNKRPRVGRFLCSFCLKAYSSDMRDFER